MAAQSAPAARYDKWADWYESYLTGDAQGFTDRTVSVLSRALGHGAGPLLDLACGTGFYTAVLRSLGWRPLGLDLSRGQLRYARGRLPVAVADAARPPLRPGSLAAITAIMCHTDIDDYPAACQALSPTLRPGGVFVHVGVHPCYIGAFADRSIRPESSSRRATGSASAASIPGRPRESGTRSARLTCRSATC